MSDESFEVHCAGIHAKGNLFFPKAALDTAENKDCQAVLYN
jgi:hypothetical protein